MNTTELEVEAYKKNSGPYGIWAHDLYDTGLLFPHKLISAFF